ncbi:hypothetical protein LZ198_13640 [Myxococcus sp. K15C18031901]|uniref:hypothetical protein n=1 Tax=Myxococcus dinghuensis TaxID=2906761 RepID=UPI0020A7FC85|nr:hypothetical protein [Myxococcus dinghuensis]MCP3099913.1 hypothetical protein [Myxococcus dinghuensis]
MQTENPRMNLERVEEAISGAIVEAGPDHLTVHDIGAGEDITLRIDDRTTYVWNDARDEGRLTDTADVRVGYFIAGGVHVAAEVIILDPGQGRSIADAIPRRLQ